ncbi:hypothetical protein EDS67_21315 [candidate division KSB1 bacterium]|nr:MAG: hypothetical protein EDS67_21315 [candidate division KSB1 bacterium]MBC6951625.1 hypothetical protein [candidate division KSB1 bacterium]MCE7943635.1 hypothetical protein [Chlorobi bacterium CHB1]MDL1875225.1 hypothetical protein [Cytophagia bacterium CHB2]
MRKPGIRLYKLGSYVFILFALVHSLNYFSDPAKLLTNEEDRKIFHEIQTHVFNLGGFSTTTGDLLTGFNLYLSIFTLGLGMLNVFLIKHLRENVAVLKTAAAINVLITGALLAVTALFFHLPPLILFGLSCLFFLSSFVLLRKPEV